MMKSANVTQSNNDQANQRNNKSFYERLPRFVFGRTVEAEGEYLPKLTRSFEFDGEQFSLVITAARLDKREEVKKELTFVSRYPSDFEQRLEKVLRRLAIPGTINFDDKKHVLACNYRQLSEEMKAIDNDAERNQISENITENRIETALSTLFNVGYKVKRVGGKGEATELNFHPIEALRFARHKGDAIYRISFTPVFFGNALFGKNL